jgi:hypothetical protein
MQYLFVYFFLLIMEITLCGFFLNPSARKNMIDAAHPSEVPAGLFNCSTRAVCDASALGR